MRSSLTRLVGASKELIFTDHPIDASAQLAGVYRYIGAGGTVMRPTRKGPAMMFNNIVGYSDSCVRVGPMPMARWSMCWGNCMLPCSVCSNSMGLSIMP